MARSFIFGGDTGETPESLKRKRSVAEAIAAARGTPRNVGEGLSSLGNAIAYRMLSNQIGAGETMGREKASGTMASLFNAGSFPGAPPATPPMQGDISASSPSESPIASVDLSGDKQAFVETLMPAALEASQRTGVDPRIIVAQAAQETGWGKSAPGNNFFGIKSHGKPGGQTFGTHEVIDGKRVSMQDSFRQFGSPGESVAGYADFLLENPRYKPMMSAQGLDAQLKALGASGYATDPNYASSVGSIARGLPMPTAQAEPVSAYAPTQVASLDPAAGFGPEQAAPATAPVVQALARMRQGETQAPGATGNQITAALAKARGVPAPTAQSVPSRMMDPAPMAPLAPLERPTSPPLPAPRAIDGQGGATINPINGRPNLANADGSYSTELSITVTNPRINGGRPTNIPSIWGGNRFDPDSQEEDIVNQALQSGQQFPSFNSIPDAVNAAKQRSENLGAGVPQSVDQVAQVEPDLSRYSPAAGGTGGTVQAGQVGPTMEQLMQASQEPWLSDQQRALVNTLLDRKMQEGDPSNQLDIEYKRAQIDAMRNKKEGYRILSPDERKAVGIAPDDNRVYQVGPENQISAVGGQGQAQTPGVEARQRAELATQYGIDPASAEGQRFILTGTLPASDKGVTAGDREAIRNSEDAIMAGESTLGLIDKAMELSPKAYEGAGADMRAWAMSQVGDESALATREYDNIVKEQALGQLKQIFGGAPTEGERAILLEIQGSSGQPRAVRESILKRARQLVERKIAFNRERAAELRGGTYYQPDKAGSQAPVAPGAPVFAPPAAPASAEPARPTSDAEYNALPSGALFIDPDDGKTYRKP